MEEIIIDVDTTHRIKITKKYSGHSNRWVYKVLKQKFFRFLSFKKGWHSSDWDSEGGSLLMLVEVFYRKEDAIEEAEKIKRAFLLV